MTKYTHSSAASRPTRYWFSTANDRQQTSTASRC